MGLVVFSDIKKSVFGDLKMAIGRMSFSGTYATSGDTITASDLGFRRIEQLIPISSTQVLVPNATNTLMLAYASGGTAGLPFEEEANATDLTGVDVPFIALGK